MDNNILREIIDVEKEIQQSLDQARETARDWLEVRKKEMLEDLEKEEQNIAGMFRQSREKLAQEAENKAQDFIKHAERQVENIQRLDEGTLNKIVSNHIEKVLPGDP